MPLQGASLCPVYQGGEGCGKNSAALAASLLGRLGDGVVPQRKERLMQQPVDLDGLVLSLGRGVMASSEDNLERTGEEKSENSESTRKPSARSPQEQAKRTRPGSRELGVHFEDSGESDEGWIALTEQDVEAAFAHLALAFRCDMFTLKRRVQVEERARNTAEENIQMELTDCQTMLQKLDQACTDSRCKEMVEHLKSSLTVLAGAIERATVAAEKLGAVHQEARMSRATEVMVQHVENLKRHHLREHTELEEMKRLIQQNSRNRQLAENRDDGEQRPKHPSMRMFQQGSARRRVSIAVIPRQLMQFHGSENGKGAEGESVKPKAVEEEIPRRQSHCLQEDSTNNYFALHTTKCPSISHQNLQGPKNIACDKGRSHCIAGRGSEFRSRINISQTVPEEPHEELGGEEVNEECEDLDTDTFLSKGSKMELCRAWFSMPTYYWVLLWLFFLGIACLVLIRILELQKQYPFTTSDS
nr:PREDICTED: protein MRVI1 isoform X2 [Anolis carolinensis]|eukprot:XP_016848813.1 PREDICTED: protein MRVI1 isoform X2 [Anolis carolinensis]